MPLFHCNGDGLLNADPNPVLHVNAKFLPPTNHPRSNVTTPMFEVPLERCSTSLNIEDSSSQFPQTFLFYKGPAKHSFIQNNEAVMSKKNGRQRLSTWSPLSMPQGLMPSTTALFFRTVEHMHVVGPKTIGSKGTWGISMAVIVAIVALIAAAKQRLFTDLNKLKEPLCVQCGGYGVQKCYLCKGRGIVVWEGKLRHSDPCPVCLGTCKSKCSACSGFRVWTMR